jgi:hypothetical protein
MELIYQAIGDSLRQNLMIDVNLITHYLCDATEHLSLIGPDHEHYVMKLSQIYF